MPSAVQQQLRRGSSFESAAPPPPPAPQSPGSDKARLYRRPSTADAALRLLKKRHPKLARSRSRPALANTTNALRASDIDDEYVPPEQLVRVGCPHCSRKFAPESAERHILICANNKSKPKPPPKVVECYTDRLGIRRGGRGSLCSTANENMISTKSAQTHPQPVRRKNSLRGGRGPSRQSRRRSAGSVTGTNPAPPAQEQPQQPADRMLVKMSQKWGEIMFLLRRPITNDSELRSTWQKACSAIQFLQELKETADDLGILQGTLSRWLLPFDNSTSVSDQAAAQHQLGSSDLDGIMSHAQRRRLVAEATSLRGLIRVKIADNADLEQASASVRAIDRFMSNLRKVATQQGVAPFELLQKL